MNPSDFDEYEGTSIALSGFADRAEAAGMTLQELRATRDKVLRFNGDRAWVAKCMARSIDRAAAKREEAKINKAAADERARLISERAAKLPAVHDLAPLRTWVVLARDIAGPDRAGPVDFVGAYDTGAGVLLTTADDQLLFLPAHRLRRSHHEPQEEVRSDHPYALYELWGEASVADSEVLDLRNKLHTAEWYLEKAEEDAQRRIDKAKEESSAQVETLNRKVETLQESNLHLVAKLSYLQEENRKLRAELAAGGLSDAPAQVGNLSELHDVDGNVALVPTNAGALIRTRESPEAERSFWQRILGK